MDAWRIYSSLSRSHPPCTPGQVSVNIRAKEASKRAAIVRCQKIARSKAAAGPSRSPVLSFAALDPVANPVCMPPPVYPQFHSMLISRRPAPKSKRNPVERPAAVPWKGADPGPPPTITTTSQQPPAVPLHATPRATTIAISSCYC
jgi:hypothetical protein